MYLIICIYIIFLFIHFHIYIICVYFCKPKRSSRKKCRRTLRDWTGAHYVIEQSDCFSAKSAGAYYSSMRRASFPSKGRFSLKEIFIITDANMCIYVYRFIYIYIYIYSYIYILYLIFIHFYISIIYTHHFSIFV